MLKIIEFKMRNWVNGEGVVFSGEVIDWEVSDFFLCSCEVIG